MQGDEKATVDALNERRRLFAARVTQAGGRIVNAPGDSVLAEFPSVVHAVQCALDIQRAIRVINGNVPDGRRMDYRIGLNVGDVIVDDSGIYGDGVNIAARLEALAPPGGVCVSGAVREQIDKRLSIRFEDLGKQSVKNIAEPIQVFLIVDEEAGGQRAERPAPRTSRALSEKPSIAVLPFRNMSGDADQDYFADGIVEELITGLSRIRWLFVIARNSSFVYKGRTVDIKQVAGELGVRYVLEGSVRKAANRLRVSAQLLEADTGRHVWAERYDRSLDDIFDLQDEITIAIVAAIEPSLRSAEIDRVKRKRPENLHAYDLLLRAISEDMAMPEAATRAMPFLERALELEPDYARAHGHLALYYHNLYARGGLRDENRQAAIRHAHAAIASGQDDSIALTLAGFVIGMDEHDRAAASQAFEAALTLSPSSAFTYLLGSPVFGWGGEGERAIDWAERALRLSPLDPWNFFCCHGLVLGHFLFGRYQEAAAAARKAIQLNPRFSMSHMLLAASLSKLGRIEEAKGAAARVVALQPTYKFGKHFASVDCAPQLAAGLGEALRTAGLSE
jgi:TolB-like protein/Tfp pilus assembly protein PilF